MTALLTEVFNRDFKDCRDFNLEFFARPLTLADLSKACKAICASELDTGTRRIPGAVRIPGRHTGGQPFVILAQLHGNEPAGVAGILLAMALAQTGELERDVIGVIGNPLAAHQYFEAWEKTPHARQETRDAYRCGLSPDGSLLPDMNRIPVDFLTREPTTHHARRAIELHAIGQMAWGVLDIHSARGNLVCFTDHKRDADLKHSPIRNVMTDLAEAISAHASGAVTVQTLKTIFGTLFDLESQTGIEVGRHESPQAPQLAASFTLSLLHTLGLTTVPPLHDKEDGLFIRYAVRPRLSYADLPHANTLREDDKIYMAKACQAPAAVPERSNTVIVRKSDNLYALQSVTEFKQRPEGTMEFAVYQYDEMEPIEKDQVLAVALPSGTVFTAPKAFSGIFVSKSAALYDKDPAVGPWPVAAKDIALIKFCYPCEVGEMKVVF